MLIEGMATIKNSVIISLDEAEAASRKETALLFRQGFELKFSLRT